MTDEEAPIEPEKDLKIAPQPIEDEMATSYMDYAMSVIVSRALPDVRDGLKPVHRRILFAMNDMGMHHNKPFKKSARIVGEVLGKYHPHGDLAVYDALARMVQDFSLRYPLIQGQGNFGSIDGDRQAAMRYTEARLAKIAGEMLDDIQKETVDYRPNFDASLKEPIVLPARLPSVLVNGASGIAVGMATNLAPHNLHEVCDGIMHIIDNPDCEPAELMDFVKGPDFPTGGIVCGVSGIQRAYLTGKGRVKVRGKYHIEEKKRGRSLIFTEIPYQVNKSQLLESCADLVKSKTIEGIRDLRDESDRRGMRVVIELKSDANPEIVINQLMKHTRFQTTFSIQNLVLVNNQPKTLTLKEMMEEYIKHREEVVRRRTAFDLKKAKKRAHVLKGLIIALDNIDAVIALIKKSSDAKIALEGLMDTYSLTDVQAQAILDMRLQRLTSLEQDKIREELLELKKIIEGLTEILEDRKKILSIIKKELMELQEGYESERRTTIDETLETDIDIEDLIEEEDQIVTVTHLGYIKRQPLDVYRAQHRGGKGITATGTKDEDFVEHIFVANTHSYLLCFTNKGQVHWVKVYRIPEGGRYAKGKAVVNLIGLTEDEVVKAMIPIKDFEDGMALVFSTKKGLVKKTSLMAYSRPRSGGIIAIDLVEGDELVNVVKTDGDHQLMLATARGMASRIHESNIRTMGRNTRGVIGIRLNKGDSVVGLVVADTKKTLLTITENGYGKRTPIEDYRLINRGGKGVINIKTTDRNGLVSDVKVVDEDCELMLISKDGILIRTRVDQISEIGRNTQGVRIMRLGAGDKVISAAKIIQEGDELEEDLAVETSKE